MLQQEHALSLVLAALEPLDTRHLLLPVSFISRLITTAQEVFAVQYVQVRVLHMCNQSSALHADMCSAVEYMQMCLRCSAVSTCRYAVWPHRCSSIAGPVASGRDQQSEQIALVLA